MIVKIIALMANLVMAQIDATINPNELTVIEFEGQEIKVGREDKQYIIKPELGDGEMSKVMLTTGMFNRGMFVRVCDIQNIELSKLNI
jgi:hypothetical protein